MENAGPMYVQKAAEKVLMKYEAVFIKKYFSNYNMGSTYTELQQVGRKRNFKVSLFWCKTL